MIDFGHLQGLFGGAALRRQLADQREWLSLAKSKGPLGIKVGQYIALRPDIVTDNEVRKQLLALTDQAAAENPMPYETVAKIIKASLGEFPGDFAWISTKPFASASLAQVHRAELRSGETVAVKVLREGVEEEVKKGIEQLKQIAQRIEKDESGLWRNAVAHAKEIEQWLMRELNFEEEAATLRVFGELLADSPTVAVPRLYPSQSGDRVVTMEYIRGVPLSRVWQWRLEGQTIELKERNIDCDVLATNLIEAMLEQIFVHQRFHADTHPGNLLVLPGNRIGFVDFGLVDVLDPRFGRGLHRYLQALYENDVDDMLQGIRSMLLPTEEANWDKFKEAFMEQNRQWQISASQAGRSSTGQYITAVLGTANETGYRIPAAILAMMRALYTANFIAEELGARADLRAAGRRFFAEYRWRALTEMLEPAVIEGEILRALSMVRDGPSKVYNVLSALANEQLVVRVENSESSQTATRASARAQLVALGVAAVSLALLIAGLLVMPEGNWRFVVSAVLGLPLGWCYWTMWRLAHRL